MWGFCKQTLIVNLLHMSAVVKAGIRAKPRVCWRQCKNSSFQCYRVGEIRGGPHSGSGFPRRWLPEGPFQAAGQQGLRPRVHGGWNLNGSSMEWEMSGPRGWREYRTWGRGFSLFSGSKRDMVARAQVLESLKPRKETWLGSELRVGVKKRD